MILTIWRHGQAEEGTPDRQRVLTESGRDDVSFGCQQFHQASRTWSIPHPDRILCSSWLRTTQTAAIIAAAFPHAVVEEAGALVPTSDVAAVDTALSAFMDAENTDGHAVLVSHQPLVSQLVNHYLGGTGAVPGLPPGGLATLSLEFPGSGCGRLLFWASPPEYEASV
jgi:phosphohistidine phosphatase